MKRLVAALGRRSIHAVRTREPGGTPKAEAIRSLILQGRSESWGPGAEAVLFAAARLDHVNQLIAPSLASGKWVISDRFHDSTRAYQGAAGAVDPALIAFLESHVLAGVAPDLTLVLDLPVEAGLARAAARGDGEGRFEAKGAAFHERLREAFLEIAAREPGRCAVIDATGDADAVAARIAEAAQERLGL